MDVWGPEMTLNSTLGYWWIITIIFKKAKDAKWQEWDNVVTAGLSYGTQTLWPCFSPPGLCEKYFDTQSLCCYVWVSCQRKERKGQEREHRQQPHNTKSQRSLTKSLRQHLLSNRHTEQNPVMFRRLTSLFFGRDDDISTDQRTPTPAEMLEEGWLLINHQGQSHRK